MTWKEFKELVEAAGVKDDAEIEWIDTHGPPGMDIEIVEKDGIQYVIIF